jgi:hypothetical protein
MDKRIVIDMVLPEGPARPRLKYEVVPTMRVAAMVSVDEAFQFALGILRGCAPYARYGEVDGSEHKGSWSGW